MSIVWRVYFEAEFSRKIGFFGLAFVNTNSLLIEKIASFCYNTFTLEEGRLVANSYAVAGDRKVQAAEGRRPGVNRDPKGLVRATETSLALS